MHTIHLVREFHERFGHPIAPAPHAPSREVLMLRYRLILEELLELGRAIGIDGLVGGTDEEFKLFVDAALREPRMADNPPPVDLEAAADALADLDYVIQGANLVFGFPAEAIVREVHAANMSKLGADGKPLYGPDGKVLKGPNTRKPDIIRILAAAIQSET